MGLFLLIVTGALAGLCAWLLAGTSRGAISEGLGRKSVGLRLVVWLNRVGSFIPSGLFEVVSCWRTCADELVRFGQERSWKLAREGALVVVAGVPALGATLGFIVSLSAVGIPIGAAGGVALCASWCAKRTKARAKQIASQVPAVFRSLSGALASGKTLAQAVSYVGASGSGTLYREFGRVAMRISCGSSATEALADLPERIEAPGVNLMVMALGVSARTGAPLQELFGRAARMVERRFELERELSSKTAQVRLSARIVSGLPVGLVAALALLSPDYREGLSTQVGTGCVAMAALLDICALIIIRRLMKGVF